MIKNMYKTTPHIKYYLKTFYKKKKTNKISSNKIYYNIRKKDVFPLLSYTVIVLGMLFYTYFNNYSVVLLCIHMLFK